MDFLKQKKELLGYVNHNYTIIEVLGDFCLAYNENAPQKYVTWIWDVWVDKLENTSDYDFYYGHYWNDKELAYNDLICRFSDN